MSTASGIADFKSTDENWAHELPRAEVMSLPYFLQEPLSFWKIYREVFGTKLEAAPNDIHRWLASLEEYAEVTIITQNVDGLHQLAGSSRVIEVHGSGREAICLTCGKKTPMEALAAEELPTFIPCQRPLKPNVSLFLES